MLCRKQIILEVQNDSLLNYNYQYKLMKNLYEALTLASEELGKRLHNEGYKLGVKQYKLFNHTLLFNDNEFSSKGIIVKANDEVKLLISGKEEIVKNMIKGLILRGTFSIDDTTFKIINMEADRPVRFKNTMLYKVITPIVETTIKNEEKQYTNPFQPEFYNALAKNLKRKYQLIYGKEYEGVLYFDIDDIFKVKPKAINRIKENGQVKGAGKFDIWIQADPDMQKVAYYCGLGQNNSVGAGMLTYITGRWSNE